MSGPICVVDDAANAAFQRQLTDLFQRFDDRGDGLITAEELERVLRVLSHRYLPAEGNNNVDQMIIGFLENAAWRHGGSICYAEFVSWIMGGGKTDAREGNSKQPPLLCARCKTALPSGENSTGGVDSQSFEQMQAKYGTDSGWLEEYFPHEDDSQDQGSAQRLTIKGSAIIITGTTFLQATSSATRFLHGDEGRGMSWNVDMAKFADQEGVAGKPILALGLYLISHCDLVTSIPVWMLNAEACSSEPFNDLHLRVQNFFHRLDGKYHANPYHNALHACDVMKNMYVLFQSDLFGYLKGIREWTYFVALFSAGIHDMGHTGQTNNYHIAIASDLAIRYNDTSPLEQMHIASAFELMRTYPDSDWFSIFRKDTVDHKGKVMPIQSRFRKTIIAVVLATDNLKHVEVVGKLEKLAACTDAKAEIKSTSTQQLALLEVGLHAADISNPTYRLPLSAYWSELIVGEFWAQGDLEKSVFGCVSMPMFDRDKADLPASQIGFYKFIAFGLWIPLATLVPEMDEHLVQMRKNLAFWEDRKAKGLREMPSKAEMSLEL